MKVIAAKGILTNFFIKKHEILSCVRNREMKNSQVANTLRVEIKLNVAKCISRLSGTTEYCEEKCSGFGELSIFTPA